jgi:hypothetical protein
MDNQGIGKSIFIFSNIQTGFEANTFNVMDTGRTVGSVWSHVPHVPPRCGAE